MRLLVKTITLLSLLNLISAADVEYSVVAFPQDQQNVAVLVNGQAYTLAQSIPNLYKGVAPAATQYQYALVGGAGDVVESVTRQQQEGLTQTGNEFFNRSQTVYNVPALPQAYNPIYPALQSDMNRGNEIATIILQVNSTGFNEILSAPLNANDYTEVFNMAFISSKEAYTFENAGIKNSGKSTREFAKQSYKIKLNEFKTTGFKELLYGRTTLKLRAHETDPTFVREKLAIDCLTAAGAATVQGQYIRLYVNNEPLGLYLMIDDSTNNFIDNILHGGNQSYEFTGPTYKGNAVNETFEGNLVYKDDNQESYPDDIYALEHKGYMKLKKADEKTPLIEFMRQLSQIDPTQAVNGKGEIDNLMNSQHTLIHMALNFMIGSWDGFWHQASNWYINKDLSNNQWTFMSYDFDETFGLGAAPYMATTPYSNFSRPNTQRPLIDVFLNSPYYKAEFEKVMTTLVKRFFKASVLGPRVEAHAAMLREDAIWDLSLEPKSPGIRPQWTLWNFDNNMNATDGNTMGVIEWVNTRSTALQQQLNITDVDDLPPLEEYNNPNVWDQNNYEKKEIGKKENAAVTSGASSRSIVSVTSLLALVCITQLFI